MKKLTALILALAMILSIAMVSASAEAAAADASQTDATTAATQSTKNERNTSAKGPGMNNRQMPNRNRQTPNSQQLPNNNQQLPNNNQQPNNSQQLPNGRRQPVSRQARPGKGMVTFETLLKNGVITQETYDNIMKYFQQNQPQQTASGDAAKDSSMPAADGQPSMEEKPADAPALPDGAEEKPAESGDLLKDLLASGAITQEAYDALVAAQTAEANK